MILLNKTMMCGGLVILAPGSPFQVLSAILIMLFHMLLVLKTAPYVKDSEDWSSFIATLGLTLMSLGALFTMMSHGENEGLEHVGVVLAVIPLLCISTSVGITVFAEYGLWNRICGKKTTTTTGNTQVSPETRVAVRSWGLLEKEDD